MIHVSARSSSRKAGFVSAVLLFLGISSVALGSWLGVPGQPGERSAALAQDPVESQGELYLWFGAVPLEEGETVFALGLVELDARAISAKDAVLRQRAAGFVLEEPGVRFRLVADRVELHEPGAQLVYFPTDQDWMEYSFASDERGPRPMQMNWWCSEDHPEGEFSLQVWAIPFHQESAWLDSLLALPPDPRGTEFELDLNLNGLFDLSTMRPLWFAAGALIGVILS